MPDYIQWIVDLVHQLGYPGIFFATFLESTFVPLPSEVTMIPAGYLVYQGKMNLFLVMFNSIAGTICGGLVNYGIALYLGRPVLLKFQKYFFLNDAKVAKIEGFFAKHGEISTLSGRLIPGLRHLISFPAGLARMNVKTFCIFTGIGGGVWMAILTAVGYYIGGKEELVKQYMPKVIIGGIALALFAIMCYILYIKKVAAKDEPNGNA